MRTPALFVPLLAATLLAGACESKSSDGENHASPEPAIEALGPLTVDFIDQLDRDELPAGAGDPWEAGYAKLQQALGPPTHIDDEGIHYWAAVEGERCASLEFHKDRKGEWSDDPEDDTPIIGITGTNHPGLNLDECLVHAGQGPELDPDAPEPPTFPAPTTVADLTVGAANKPDLWLGAKVHIDGINSQHSWQTSNGETTHRLNIVDATGDDDDLICVIDQVAGAEPWPQRVGVTVEGTVSSVQKGWLELDPCTATRTDPLGRVPFLADVLAAPPDAGTEVDVRAFFASAEKTSDESGFVAITIGLAAVEDETVVGLECIGTDPEYAHKAWTTGAPLRATGTWHAASEASPARLEPCTTTFGH